jgi:hypothetical protein
LIDSLTAFTVVPEYGRAQTVYRVLVDGQSTPAAVLRKDSVYDSRQPLQAYTGPELSQPAGWVSTIEAMTADRVKLGRVSLRKGSALRKDHWTFAQVGLPELTGEPVGAGAALRRSPLRGVLGNGIADGVLSLQLHFGGPESEGFDFTRFSGVKARYGVEIHDPRVSRLLVLACVVHYNVFVDADPRQFAVDVTTNPLKG